MYKGFKRSYEVVQFDIIKNRFLAAADECMIKYWHMDHVGLLKAYDAGGGLLASPSIRFNKEGSLLAVSTNDNGIKILANMDGIRVLSTKNGDVKMENSEIWKSTEITEPTHCCFIKLPGNTGSAMRVSRLIYSHFGAGILVLAADVVHKLWKWTRYDRNLTGKAQTILVNGVVSKAERLLSPLALDLLSRATFPSSLVCVKI